MKYILLGVGIFISYSYYNLLKYSEALIYLDAIMNNEIGDDEHHLVEIPIEFSNKNLDECVICLEQIKKDQIISRLKCGHQYHYNCLKQWTNTNSNCPMCRSII